MVLGVSALGAQQSDSLLKAQLTNGMYPPNDARAILAVLTEAEARRLPTDGLEWRVRDGVAHNADGARTIGVVRAYLAALVESRNTLGPSASATVRREARYMKRYKDQRISLFPFRSAP